MLGLLVWNIGIGEVVAHLRQIGWLAPLLLVPYIAIALCDAKGWACAIPFSAHARKVPLWRLSLARVAGEAVNNLTPTANLGGEPIKVYLLRAHGLTVDTGLASVVVAKTTLMVSQVVFILLGLPFFLYRLGWIRQGWWVLAPLLILAYGFVMLLIRWQRRGLMTEACDIVTDYWFNTLRFPVLRAPKAVANVASRRISEKQGMRLVACEDRHYVSGRLPAELWEITAEEWNARRQR